MRAQAKPTTKTAEVITETKSIDLVSVMISAMLVVGFACALVVPFASSVASLSQWVH